MQARGGEERGAGLPLHIETENEMEVNEDRKVGTAGIFITFLGVEIAQGFTFVLHHHCSLTFNSDLMFCLPQKCLASLSAFAVPIFKINRLVILY